MSITTVFTNNRSQAVRLPADVRLPEGVKKVQVRARGMDRIISPVGHTWDEFFFERAAGVRRFHGRARHARANRAQIVLKHSATCPPHLASACASPARRRNSPR